MEQRWEAGRVGGKPAKTADPRPGPAEHQGGSCPLHQVAERSRGGWGLQRAGETNMSTALDGKLHLSLKELWELLQEAFQHQIPKTQKKKKKKTKNNNSSSCLLKKFWRWMVVVTAARQCESTYTSEMPTSRWSIICCVHYSTIKKKKDLKKSSLLEWNASVSFTALMACDLIELSGMQFIMWIKSLKMAYSTETNKSTLGGYSRAHNEDYAKVHRQRTVTAEFYYYYYLMNFITFTVVQSSQPNFKAFPSQALSASPHPPTCLIWKPYIFQSLWVSISELLIKHTHVKYTHTQPL